MTQYDILVNLYSIPVEIPNEDHSQSVTLEYIFDFTDQKF